MYRKCRFKMNSIKNNKLSSQFSILFVIINVVFVCLIGDVVCDSEIISEDNDNIRNINNKGSIIPFTCPEDFGYYPHPTSCTQYYVCVFGSSILESCSKGLMYSKELQTCDWERNVKGGCSNNANSNNNGTIGSTIIVDPVNVINNPNPSDPQQSKPDVTSDLTSNNLRNSRSYETELPDYKRELAYGEIPIGRLKRQANNYYHSSHPQQYNYNYFNGGLIPLDRQRQTNMKPYANHNDQHQYHHHNHPHNQLIDIYNYGRGVQVQSLTTTMRPLLNNYNNKINKDQLVVQSSNNNNNNADEDEYYYDDDDNATDKNSISNQTDHTNSRSAAASSSRANSFQYSREVVATTSPPIDASASNEDLSNQYYLVNQRYGESTTSANTPIYTNYDNSNTYPAVASPVVQQPQPLANNNVNRYNTKSTVAEPQYYQPQTHIQQQPQPAPQQQQPINLRPIYYNNSTYTSGLDGSQTNPAVDYSGDYYYDYDDAPIIATTQRPTTTTTTTTRAPKVIYSNSRGSTTYNNSPQQQSQSQSQPQSTRTKSRVSPLPPKSKILSKASHGPVRNIYLDPPSRPEPVYETPEPGSSATKCKRSHCVIPDCNCGGTPIPGGFEAPQIPQIVLLTFDDSVNDLNKDLYRDLFEKGRKNPNGCPISGTFYVSHEWTDYTQVQNLAADGHEIASHSITHSFGEQFSPSKWLKEVHGQREILSAFGGVKLNEIRGMRAPFLAIGGNNMFKMLYEGNFTYDSSMPVYENKPPSWPYTLDYKIFHDCMIPPCPTKSWPGVWEVPMVMWQDLKGGRCSMGDACSNPPTAEGVYEMLVKNFERHYTTNRAPFGLYYHAAWFTTPHHKEGFESFLDVLTEMDDVWIITNWQALQWIRSPTPLSEILSFQPWQCNDKSNIPPRCNSGKVCNLWHKGGVRYMKTCQPCPEKYPWVGSTGVTGNSL